MNWILKAKKMRKNKASGVDSDTQARIIDLFNEVEVELNKPYNDIDMEYIDSIFSQIRELDGNSFELTDEEIERGLQKIYQKAVECKKREE